MTLQLYAGGKKLLEALMRASPAVVTKDRLESLLWGDDPPDGDMLRSHIYELRKSVDGPFAVKLIHTVPKVGYRIAPPERIVMAGRLGLRQRITIAALAYLLLVAVIVATHGYLVNERAEHLVWESLLESELEHFNTRLAVEPSYRFADTETLKLYGPRGAAVPPELAGTCAWRSRRSSDAARPVRSARAVAGRRRRCARARHLRHRTSRAHAHTGDGHVDIRGCRGPCRDHPLGSRLARRPLSSIARAIVSFAPNRAGQRVSIDKSAPSEAEVIAVALNDYLQRIDEFVARERAFVNMASHELRTPIAVISGAAEVALDQRTGGRRGRSPLEPYFAHCARHGAPGRTPGCAREGPGASARCHRERGPPRARPGDRAGSCVSRGAQGAEFRLGIAGAATIRAPEQVVRAAIGNLVRNAVENSDRGIIDVNVDGSEVIIEDPGHGMSNEEMSALYTRLARTGDTPPSGGIGLELIARLCEHLGWKLSFSSAPRKGTRAVLDLGAAPCERPTRFRHAVR